MATLAMLLSVSNLNKLDCVNNNNNNKNPTAEISAAAPLTHTVERKSH
jgi:hypothetical protein